MRQSGSGGRLTGSVGCLITSVFFCWVTCVFYLVSLVSVFLGQLCLSTTVSSESPFLLAVHG